jgi:A/G-specific adenine glycosylase
MNLDPLMLGNKVTNWWRKHRRSYPWRKTSDPYKILIAEIMLQRTKADQVVPVYCEFVERFPTIFHLERASENELNRYFCRLGLMWRAVAIRKMVDFLIERHKGILPRDREELLKVPAIGEYIADAILSFAYKQRAVVIDSNVCRIIKRVYSVPIKGESRRNKHIRAIATKMLPSQGSSRSLNFALLDFAALICRAKDPLCGECPLISRCDYGLKCKHKQAV